MLARVAWHVYWLARYVERVENSARLVSVHNQYSLEMRPRSRQRWKSLLRIFGATDASMERLGDSGNVPVMRYLLSAQGNPDCLFQCINHARDNAQSLRDQLPVELQERVNVLYLYAAERLLDSDEVLEEEFFEILSYIARGSQLFFGIVDGTMDRDRMFLFMQLGRMIERSDMITRVLDVHLEGPLGGTAEALGEDAEMSLQAMPADPVHAAAVLRSLSSLLGYRQEHPGIPEWAGVVAFLLQDRGMPRAFCYCMDYMQELLLSLPGSGRLHAIPAALERRVQALHVQSQSLEQLHGLFDDLQAGLQALDGEISRDYFRHGV